MPTEMNGAQKAAMLLMSLGEEASALLIKYFTKEEIKKLGVQLNTISTVRKDVSDELLEQFTSSFSDDEGIYTPGSHFLKNLLPNVLGEEADSMMSRIEMADERVPFNYIQDIDSKVLANFIKTEHPQTITVVMAHLTREKAGQVLQYLPEHIQYEVVERLAQIEMVPPDLIREVDEVLQKELLSLGQDDLRVLGGIPVVAEILNSCDRSTGDGIFQIMEERDGELAEQVRKLMFIFDDLGAVNDVGIRELLKEVRNEELILALKTASDELKDKVLRNLSKRAAEMLQEDMTVLGPVRLSDVEAAQQSILMIARRLEKEGRIVLAGKDGGDALV